MTWEYSCIACSTLSLDGDLPKYSETGESCEECVAPNVVNPTVEASTGQTLHTSCLPCRESGYGAREDQTGCDPCTGTTISIGGVCEECPPYTVVNDDHTVCFSCDVGKVENFNRSGCVALSCYEEAVLAGELEANADLPELSVRIDLRPLCAAEVAEQHVCQECPAPFVVNEDWTSCDPCPPGRGPNHNRTKCNDCVAQNFSSSGVCFECAPPNVLILGANETKIGCTNCAPGQQPNVPHTGCDGCGPGTYSPRGTLCETCAAPNPERTECTTCAAGRGPNEDGTECIICDPGHFSAEGFCASCARPNVVGPVGNDEKTTCAPCNPGSGPTSDGTWGSEDAYTECTDCRSGQYSQTGICSNCEGNSQVSSDRIVCTACTPGRTASEDQTSCDDNDECLSVPCQNNATCADSITNSTIDDDVYECDCLPGWSDHNCATNTLECASGPCQNNGVCIDDLDAFVCLCPSGWWGDRCHRDVNECDETHYDWLVQGEEGVITLEFGNRLDFSEFAAMEAQVLVHSETVLAFKLMDEYGRTVPEDGYLQADTRFPDVTELELLCSPEVAACADAQDCMAELDSLRSTGNEPETPSAQLVDLLVCVEVAKHRLVLASCVELSTSPCTPSEMQLLAGAEIVGVDTVSSACSLCVESLEPRHLDVFRANFTAAIIEADGTFQSSSGGAAYHQRIVHQPYI